MDYLNLVVLISCYILRNFRATNPTAVNLANKNLNVEIPDRERLSQLWGKFIRNNLIYWN